jgi:hypothetical protein
MAANPHCFSLHELVHDGGEGGSVGRHTVRNISARRASMVGTGGVYWRIMASQSADRITAAVRPSMEGVV